MLNELFSYLSNPNFPIALPLLLSTTDHCDYYYCCRRWGSFLRLERLPRHHSWPEWQPPVAALDWDNR